MMKVYSEYKDSNIGWLGKIPTHWQAKRIKHVAFVNPSKTNSGLNRESPETAVFLPMERVGEDGSYRQDIKKPIDELWSGFTYFEKGDVIVAKITPCFENGKGADLTELETKVGFGSTEFHVLRPLKKESIARYLYYLSFSDLFRGIGEVFMTGAAGQQRISTDFVREFKIACPPLPEQRAIADFLDRKTAQIDSLIAKKQKQIALLEEHRQAVINQAVTKGLNPAAPMKDSGIEWLGEVPAGWVTMQLKRLLLASDYGISTRSEERGRYRVLGMGNVNNQGEVNASKGGFVNEVNKNLILENGDLLFNRTNSWALVGKVGVFRGSHTDEITFASYLVRLRIDPEMADSEYINYLLNSYRCIHFARSLAIPSISQANLNATRYGNSIRLPIPSLREQQQILEYLNGSMKKIKTVIQQTENEIEQLKEYRTTLIANAVTGKIDVRGEG